MARGRNIKPGFFTNDELVELPLSARLLFIGLWTIADREGRLIDRPKKIKMEIFPADDIDCDSDLAKLASSGFITRYEADDIKVISIENFCKHQAPHTTEKDSVLPDCSGYYTVNKRSPNGVITGNPQVVTKAERESNVKSTLKPVNPPVNNALIPLSSSLIPDSPILIPEPLKEVKPIAPSSDEAFSRNIDIEAVFNYWQNQRGHERAKLDDKRRKAIKARLKDGYTIEDLCRAVDGVSKSAHHMGQNEQRTVYDDIELICRSGTNVDKFQKLAGPQQFTDPGLQRQVDILKDWMEKP